MTTPSKNFNCISGMTIH